MAENEKPTRPTDSKQIEATDSEKEKLIRQYAAGEVTWRTLQRRGFDNYVQVLAGLGELGLRPPVAPMEGPNVEARRRGIALLRQRLREKAKP